MTQAFDHEALYAKSKVYIERSFKAEHERDQAGFQLWASLSLELLGKATLARIHPALVADPGDLDSLFAACGQPFSPKRRSITAKTVFERLGHICKHFLREEKDFCMEMANRRNAELHSGELPYTEMRAITWVPKLWKVCKMLLEAQGKPRQIDLDVPPQVFAAVRKGRMTVPLGDQPALAEVAGLPWGSVATLRSNGEKLHRVVGPAIRQKDQWALPVLFHFFEPETGLEEYQEQAPKLRRSWGLEPASA